MMIFVRGRAGAPNIVPSTTGAQNSRARFTKLEEKFDGNFNRVRYVSRVLVVLLVLKSVDEC
jgi:glyceraldehyde-3-phosphate dehydrogenase/erythrose-4-phosphate dehydrogenase